MKLTADYHTHTKFSHGKGTILDNALKAKEMGLSEIAITDHGFSHIAFGMRRRKLAQMKLEASVAQTKTGVKVLIGTEANLFSLDGKIDCKNEDKLQVVVCGFHKFVLTKFGQYFRLCLSNIVREIFMGKKKYHSVSLQKGWVKRNTKALVNAINNNKIDIVSHPNRHFRVDVLEVAKACEKTNTKFEINNKNLGCSLEELKQVVEKTNCKFVLSTDAHTPNAVGNVDSVWDKIKNIVPEDRIVNINGKLLDRKHKN